jgi:hypothetical protein
VVLNHTFESLQAAFEQYGRTPGLDPERLVEEIAESAQALLIPTDRAPLFALGRSEGDSAGATPPPLEAAGRHDAGRYRGAARIVRS